MDKRDAEYRWRDGAKNYGQLFVCVRVTRGCRYPFFTCVATMTPAYCTQVFETSQSSSRVAGRPPVGHRGFCRIGMYIGVDTQLCKFRHPQRARRLGKAEDLASELSRTATDFVYIKHPGAWKDGAPVALSLLRTATTPVTNSINRNSHC